MVVFLVCHSVKLIINGYEVYEMVKSNVDMSPAISNEELPNNNFVPPIRVTMNETRPQMAEVQMKEQPTEEPNVEHRLVKVSKLLSFETNVKGLSNCLLWIRGRLQTTLTFFLTTYPTTLTFSTL